MTPEKVTLVFLFLLMTGCQTMRPVLSPYVKPNYDRITKHCSEWFRDDELQNEVCYFAVHLWESENKHFERGELWKKK